MKFEYFPDEIALAENNEKSAKDFCDAIRMFAEKPENLQNLECYLSRHFREWMKKYANDPESIAAELKEFAIW